MHFPKTTKEEDKICEEESFRIFGELRKKHSNNSVHDLDILLNTFCLCLVRLGYTNVGKKDAEAYVGLIQKIVRENLFKMLED